ncbi:vWA domain-containing protein [Salinisphaera sp. T31B1]|uniref:vWA domain-containing protein n=1 Tax=Salinisphaera sp. T31B1 TaxID=727963 RepID=UPI00334196BB
MSLVFDHPAVLAALWLALLPWWRLPLATSEPAALVMLPADRLSVVLDLALRAAASLAIAALVFGLARPFLGAQTIEKVARGAHLVLTLDRSLSMDQTFAGRNPQGGEESKSETARRLLTEFIGEREHDLFGVVSFSTRPMAVVPLSDDRVAARAAVDAAATPGLAFTNVAEGLFMALSYFRDRRASASRAIVLISDGAAEIDFRSAERLRARFAEYDASLYWIFLRTAGSPGLFEKPDDARNDNAKAMPERYLHLFFNTLQVPYTPYEADNPAALAQAIADIDRLETRPLVYAQRIPRRDLSGWAYAIALVLLLVGLLAKIVERRVIA